MDHTDNVRVMGECFGDRGTDCFSVPRGIAISFTGDEEASSPCGSDCRQHGADDLLSDV